jgi:hypothetical protein
MANARQFWNGFLPLVRQIAERRRMRDHLSLLLQYITNTTDKSKYKKADGVC